MTQGGVAGPQGFHDSNEGGTLQDENKQTRHGGEACHSKHKQEDDHNIHVEQGEPREYARIEVLYGGIGEVSPVVVLLMADQSAYPVGTDRG